MSSARDRLRTRLLRLTAMAVAALAAAYGGALALLSREDVEAVLRSRIEAVLRAQLGELSLGEQVRVDPLFRVTFGPLTVAGVRPEDPPLLRVERLEARPRAGAARRGRQASHGAVAPRLRWTTGARPRCPARRERWGERAHPRREPDLRLSPLRAQGRGGAGPALHPSRARQRDGADHRRPPAPRSRPVPAGPPP